MTNGGGIGSRPGTTPSPGKPNHGKRITHILRNLFHQVLLPKRDEAASRHAIAPSALVKALPTLGSCGNLGGYKFRPGRQEDAHEFLVHLLDAMNDGELRSAGIHSNVSGWRDRLPIPRLDETTFVHRVFGGYFRSQVLCVGCGHRSNTYDPFLNLSLEVSGKDCRGMSDALREFTRKETLDKNNRWKCPGCEKKVCATKQLTVFRPPLTLCVQLKRFAFGGMGGFGLSGGFGSGWSPGLGGKKITKPIDFPAHFHLQLSDKRSCAYSLTGLVIHVGGSASSGHYTACVKRPHCGKDQWFEVDDSFVQAVSEPAVLRQRDAYLLFYCRQEVKLEFPTPPLRSSMTAGEAMELSRKRARARAESMEQRILERLAQPDSSGDSKANEDPQQLRIATQATCVASSRSNSVGSEPDEGCCEKANAGMDPHVVADNSLNVRSIDSDAGRDKSTSSSSSSGSSNSESTSSASSAGDDSSPASSDESVDSTRPAHSAPLATSNAVQPSTERDPKTGIDMEERIKSATAHQAKTRIVVDRGAGRGKVEVMLGPRYKKKKTWKPIQGGSAPGIGFGLLGNRPVSQWDEEDDRNPHGLQIDKRTKLEGVQERKEKAHKRKVFTDRWDRYLDQGKLKKVKSKGWREQAPNNSTTNAQFQRLQERKFKPDSD